MQPQAPAPRLSDTMPEEDEADEEEDEDEDEEDAVMGNTAANGVLSTGFSAAQSQAKFYRSPESTTHSSTLEKQSQYQSSSYASSVSTLPSPAFGPQGHARDFSQSHISLSASTSPTIMPSLEQDQEASAALLMLNKERRNPKGGRAMSVKDLLSS